MCIYATLSKLTQMFALCKKCLSNALTIGMQYIDKVKGNTELSSRDQAKEVKPRRNRFKFICLDDSPRHQEQEPMIWQHIFSQLNF